MISLFVNYSLSFLSDHCRVLLDVEWVEKGSVTQEK